MTRNVCENNYVFNKKEFDHSINMMCISVITVLLILLLFFSNNTFTIRYY